MGALLSHHVGRALGNSGADHHGATVHPGDDPPGVAKAEAARRIEPPAGKAARRCGRR